VALDACAVRGIVERVFERREVLAACQRRDLGQIIRVLGAHGVTQGRIAELTGIGQGRLSEWAGGRRTPRATSTFEAFADGLGLPPAARQALGLAPGPGTPVRAVPRPSSGRSDPPAAKRPDTYGMPMASPGRVSPDSLADLRGLEPVQDQLRDVLAILEAERGREQGGWTVRRRAWKNLVFTGGPGSGKSRTAAAVARAYWKLGLLSSGHVLEVAAADLNWTDAGETGTLADKMFKGATGGVLLINGADDWYRLPDRGLHVARQLYAQLTEYRATRDDQVAVILTGLADPLHKWLHGHPQLAARFLAVIDFPRYTLAQLAAVFGQLADEAGLRLTIGARQKAAAVIEQAEREDRSGNARLAVRLLNEARAAQAQRVTRESSADRDLAALVTITEADIPERLLSDATGWDDDRPSPYL
jgi:transcriptional regulator with XRE-family HTH domain